MVKPNLIKPVKAFIDKLSKAGGKPLYELTPEEARNVLLTVQADDGALPDADVDEITVSLENGREMRVLIVRPSGVEDTLPIIFIFTAAAGLWETRLPMPV